MSNIPESWTKDQERLWELADQDNCDGLCVDIEPLYEKCPECLARSAVNEIGEIVSERLFETDESTKLPVKEPINSPKPQENRRMEKLRVKRADNCIWLIDDREKHQEIHLTPSQAKEFGQKLIDISTETPVTGE